MRFIHTSDWQIGKPFSSFGEKEGTLRQARLATIERIGRLAEAEGVDHVLVAGDVYDAETPTEKTLREPLERMGERPGVTWHLLPGNHDPHRPQGLWERLRETNPPPNIRLHLTPAPAPLGPTAFLLPAPLTKKSEQEDQTSWMDAAETAPGLIRIGLAHGSVAGFGSEGEASNPIAPDRPERARLDYLALGDWHRTNRIGPRVWYSGTPEPDRIGSQKQEQGQVLLVEIERPGATPVVTTHVVGGYRWLALDERLDEARDLQRLEDRLRQLPERSRTVLRLTLSGVLPLRSRAELDRRLRALDAAFFHLQIDDSGLHAAPTGADLEAIDFGGVLREAAERLRRMATDESLPADERRRAERALVELLIRRDAEPSKGAAA